MRIDRLPSPRFLAHLVCLVGLALAVPANAQPTPPDSVTVSAPVDSTQARIRGAVLRSLAVPGWGQVYNGDAYKAPFAAGLVIGAGVVGALQQDRYLLYSRAAFYANCIEVPDRPVCDGFESRQDEWEEAGGERSTSSTYKSLRDSARGNRDIAFVAVLGVYALQALDAYVSANLSDFDVSEDLSLRLTPRRDGAVLTLRVGL